MTKSIIKSEEMRLRMIQLEYKDFPKDEFEEKFQQEIRRIYLEEYGQKLPADVDVYSTSNPEHFKDDTSGYEGTAIHFHSEENNIDEMYVVSQGTKNAMDWEYNVKAMLAGKDITQAEGTDEFVREAKKKLSIHDSTAITGLSHSLAHKPTIIKFTIMIGILNTRQTINFQYQNQNKFMISILTN